MTALESLAASCSGVATGPFPGAGVYLLVKGETVIYVGQSRNMLARVGAHASSLDFDRVFFIAERNRKRRLALEGALTRRFNPPHVTAGAKLGGERDARILKRFGLAPDADNAAAFIARQNARWTPKARASQAANNREWRARRRAGGKAS